MLLIPLLFLFFTEINAAARVSGGITPKILFGSVWPQPQYIDQKVTYFKVNSKSFSFVYSGTGCPIIDSAIERYKTIIFNPPRLAGWPDLNATLDPSALRGTLTNITVKLQGSCESQPHQAMDESYNLKVDSPDLLLNAALTANSSWGILRGLESFSQLFYLDEEHNFYLNSTTIFDFPRFPFRGFMLDTSRHFVPVVTIKQHLDAMAYHKFNVFHWHITDDQSFPYQSMQYPLLSEKGAFNAKTHIYSTNDVAAIIEYARNLGIRVIPEFDTPGHTESWGLGQKDLLTPCYNETSPDGSYGPINPILNSTYEFLFKFFSEIGKTFPDKFVHLGGDEVDFRCWESNPNINAFMQKMGFASNYSKLESYYIDKLLKIVSSIPNPKNYIVWQEVFDNGCAINPDTVVNVWKNGYFKEMSVVTGKGFKAILSACWYLSDIHYGSDWTTYYSCEPLNFIGNQTQFNLVLGGSGCMWGEFVDSTNLMARTWPRASAIAERLWSAKTLVNTSAAAPRLEVQRCKMVERGINAEPPNGPNYCPADYLVF